MSVIPPSSSPNPADYPSYVDNPVFANLTQSAKDTLTQSLSNIELNVFFGTLPAPTVGKLSNEDFFKTISDSTRDLIQQLQATELVDQKTRRKISQAASIQANLFLTNIRTRDDALAAIQTTADAAVADLTTDIAQIAQEGANQNVNSNNYNGFMNIKNVGQQQAKQALIDSYNTYINTITSPPINAAPGGTYTIETSDPSVIDAYNDAANLYNDTLNNFNTYWATRQAEIDNYNGTVDAYNTNVADRTNPGSAAYQIAAIAELTGLTEAQIASLYPPEAVMIPPDGNSAQANYPLATDFPSTGIAYNPNEIYYDVSIAFPPDWVYDPIPQASYVVYSPISPSSLSSIIYQNLFDQIITPIDLQAETLYGDWAYLAQQSFFFAPQETAVDPLLNAKVKLIKKLFPDTDVNPQDIVQTNIARGANAMNALSVKGADHIQNILSQGLVSQIINQFNLNLSKEQSKGITDRLILLSTSMLKNHSLESILPSIGPVSAILSSLPANSPAFSLLYAISLLNRVQERSDITVDTVKAFIETQIPELSGISDIELNQLAAALNTGLLLTSANLLAASLGIPDLLPQLASSILPEDSATQAVSQASTETNQELTQLNSQLQQTYQAQGYGLDESQYLADFATKTVLERVDLAPSAVTVSADNIQVDLLKASITANLIFNDRRLADAQILANNVADRAINRLRGNTVSTAHFIDALELSLRQAGVDSKDRVEIATQALILPKFEPIMRADRTVAALIDSPIHGAIADLALDHATSSIDYALQIGVQLTASQIAQSIHHQISQLLIQQLGSKVTETIVQQTNLSIFGTTNPDSSDVAEVKSPFSLINTLKHQISLFENSQDNKLSEKVVEQFKESIKPSRRLDVFLEKIMNPAYMFIYSAFSGIMYSELPHSDKLLNPRV